MADMASQDVLSLYSDPELSSHSLEVESSRIYFAHIAAMFGATEASKSCLCATLRKYKFSRTSAKSIRLVAVCALYPSIVRGASQ